MLPGRTDEVKRWHEPANTAKETPTQSESSMARDNAVRKSRPSPLSPLPSHPPEGAARRLWSGAAVVCAPKEMACAPIKESSAGSRWLLRARARCWEGSGQATLPSHLSLNQGWRRLKAC